MRINTKLRYGLRVIIEIARDERMSGVMQGTIAKNQGISEKYLDHIINDLKKSGLIENAGGKRSGYRLTENPDTITVDRIFLAFNLLNCTVNCIEDPKSCDRLDTCAITSFWRGLDSHIVNYLKSINLQQLIDQYEKDIRRGSANA